MDLPNRLLRLQARLSVHKLNGFLITHLPNIFYLTGFTGTSAALLVLPHKSIFLTDGRYMEQAARQVRGLRICQSRKGLMIDALRILNRHRGRRWGFEARHLVFSSYEFLKKGLSANSKLVGCVDWVEELRAIKSKAEIEKIRTSLQVVTKSFEEVLPMVKPGVRERDLGAELEHRMKSCGAEKVSFDLIIASGPRSALPHGVASEKRVCRNEFLVFDLGAILGGYASDFTRTIYVGRPSTKARKVYNIVRESQERAISGVRAGIPASRIDRLARQFIHHSGFGRYFVHSTGHGIGVEVHEAPQVSAKSTAILQAGHVITVEPGIYLPGEGGVRIEDIVVVKAEGKENLTETTKELIVI